MQSLAVVSCDVVRKVVVRAIGISEASGRFSVPFLLNYSFLWRGFDNIVWEIGFMDTNINIKVR